MGGDGVEFLLCLDENDSRPENPYHVEEVVAAVVQHFRGGLQGQPRAPFHISAHFLGEGEGRGHDADHGDWLAAEFDHFAYDAGVGMEGLAPQAFRQQHD